MAPNGSSPNLFTLTAAQAELVALPVKGTICLTGQPGTGKTTVSVARLQGMLAAGIPGESILVLLPQRTLAEPYQRMLRDEVRPPGGEVDVLTLGGLARRMVQLYWPMIAADAGFASPDSPPTFLTMELAQYFMAEIVGPMLDSNPEMFTSITIQQHRLFSQILDNLNKAAVVGFDHRSLGARLQAAWTGESSQLHIYADAQACAEAFRQACYARNLLDYSLQIELFRDFIWPLPLFQTHLRTHYRHIIADNLEEDTPVTHHLLLEWLPLLDSAWLTMDEGGGYRRFLGADPESADRLRLACETRVVLHEPLNPSDDFRALAATLSQALGAPAEQVPGDPRRILTHASHRFQPEMLDWIVAQAEALVSEKGIPPGEIAVLSPFLSDALRFSLQERFRKVGLPTRSHRPSRALCEEPATRCLLTLSRLAHPQWGVAPSAEAMVLMLMMAVDGLDLVRAQLLVAELYRVEARIGRMAAFEEAPTELRGRVTYTLGEKWDALRNWLLDYESDSPAAFDIFLSRLFGELLSQPGFGFHDDFDAGAVTANVIESVQKFRWVVGRFLDEQGKNLGREYLHLVQEGLVAAQYVRNWEEEDENAVLLSPAFTFLMRNKAVDYQFWLNIGSRGWSERLYQPLTHPYVLSRSWPQGAAWKDENEVEASLAVVRTLSVGLIQRCRKGIYLGMSDIGERGYEQRGALLQAMQQVFIRTGREDAHV